MKFNFKKEILPHIIAITVFLIVTVLFYHPLFLTNQELRGNDVIQGMASGQEAREFREATGEEALWVNSMFGGMPAYLINIRWSGDLLIYVQNAITLGIPSPASVTFIAFLSFYILLLAYKVRPYLAIAGALAYGLNSFGIVSIEAGHIWKVRAIAYMPLVVAGFKLLFEGKRKFFGFVLVALALALEIKSDHLQVTYYLVLLMATYGISTLVYAIRDKDIPGLAKNTAWLLLAVALAVGCNFGRLWATYEYGNYSTRGKSDLKSEASNQSVGSLDRDYVFNWSSGKMESMTFLIPNFHGGASVQPLDKTSHLAEALKKNGASAQQIKQQISQVPTYWGDQPGVAGPVYVGAIICFLFVLGIVMVESRHRNWLIGATLLSIMLSWGKNFEFFNYFMYDYFPVYGKFRSVSMAVVIALLTMPLLGFLGLESLLSSNANAKEKQKKLLIATGVTAGICLLVIILSGIGNFKGVADTNYTNLPDWFMTALRADRASLLRSDAFRSFMFIAIFAGLVFFYLKDKISEIALITIGMVLITADLFLVDRRYINDENFKRNTLRNSFAMTPADEKIKGDHSEYRVMNLLNPWNESKTSYLHHSAGGYHGAKLRRYQELIEYCLDNEKNTFIEDLQKGTMSFEKTNVLNMVNTKYLMFGPAANNVIENNNAFGNAWLASSVRLVNSANEEIAATCNLAGKSEAIVDASRFSVSPKSSGLGTIQLTDYKPNHLTYSVDALENSLAVFSEIYYDKGWKAYINEEEVEILRANYILRALEISKGKHAVEFKFKPNAYFVGNKVMFGATGILILFFVGSVFLSLKNNENG